MASDSLSPFVFWGQNSQYVFLKVDIKDAVETQIELNDESLDFRANGVGVAGRNNYRFNVEFYLPVEDKKSRYKVTDRHIEFQLEKAGIGQIWPRLMVATKKPAWLKVDFDKVALDDDSDEEEPPSDASMREAEEMYTRQIEEQLKKTNKSVFGDLKGLYLFVYNLFQWVGFSYVFLALGHSYRTHGEQSKFEAMQTVGPQLMVCQLAAVMEVVHPLLGVVRTGVFTPLIQVFGRNLMLFGVIMPEAKLHAEPLVWWLFVTWSAVEIVRYPFYMLSSINKDSKTITWLRYTMWIPLYPLGFALESLVILKALPMYEQSGKWTLELPNEYNMSFPFPNFLRAYLVLFLIGCFILLKHMYSQRKRRLQPKKSKLKAS